MAGGPSTPRLAAAVSGAGGLGFLAGGYRTAAALRADIGEARSLLPGEAAFGVNVFAAPGHGAGAANVPDYAATLRAEAEHLSTELGDARWDDDRYAEKSDLICEERVPVVSFTFGKPRLPSGDHYAPPASTRCGYLAGSPTEASTRPPAH